MAHVILPPKKNYIPQFLKQRDINSYSIPDPGIKKAPNPGSGSATLMVRDKK
jgi:hypothetical protein